MNKPDRTTIHWAASLDGCDRMANKYGWTKDQYIDHKTGDPLPVECVYKGEAKFPAKTESEEDNED